MNIFKRILDIVYPYKCGICGKINEKSLCNRCYLRLKDLQRLKIIDIYNKNFTELISIFEYKGLIRDKILEYKFNDKAYLYNTFVNFLLKNEKVCRKIKKYDIILPIPISNKKKKTRGYNQSSLIAKNLAYKLNIEYKEDIIIKTKENLTQSELRERRERRKCKRCI